MAKRGRKSAAEIESEQQAKADLFVISKSKIKKLALVLVILLLVVVVGLVSLKYKKERDEKLKAQADIERLSDPDVSVKNAEDKLIEDVKKIVLVPDDERPTIANVTDAEKLKDQPLFALIQNGDKVLLFSKARRQIVYRPSTGQVITAVTLPADNTETNNSQTAE